MTIFEQLTEAKAKSEKILELLNLGNKETLLDLYEQVRDEVEDLHDVFFEPDGGLDDSGKDDMLKR